MQWEPLPTYLSCGHRRPTRQSQMQSARSDRPRPRSQNSMLPGLHLNQTPSQRDPQRPAKRIMMPGPITARRSTRLGLACVMKIVFPNQCSFNVFSSKTWEKRILHLSSSINCKCFRSSLQSISGCEAQFPAKYGLQRDYNRIFVIAHPWILCAYILYCPEGKECPSWLTREK